jgi:hypothetical protein
MLSLLPLLLFTTLTAGTVASPAYELLDSPMRHVRSTNRGVERLLRVGVSRSTTFTNLMSHLNASDVIVYIEIVPTLPTTLAGRLLLMPMAGDQRYLRIQVVMNGSPNDLISTIAHELRHAIEVADQPAVRTESSLVQLYERIGRRGRDAHCYETEAARTTGRAVRRELVA